MIRAQDRYLIRGACFDVHKTLGYGFNEYVYQDALAIEFEKRGIPFEKEKQLNVFYKGVKLEHEFRADFVCFGDIIVECKAVSSLNEMHEGQIINYLNVSDFPVGVLVNFGEKSLKDKTFLNKKLLKQDG